MIDDMQRHHKRFHTGKIIVISSFIFAFAVTATIFTMQQVARMKATPNAPLIPGFEQKTPGAAQFTFMGAPDWRQGPVDKVSLAAFHDGGDSCFISIQQKEGSIDIAAALAKGQADLASGGYTVSPGAVVPLTLQTTAGPLSYELHEYAISGGSAQLLGGQALSYFALPNGYAKVEAHCKTIDQLSRTIPALQALKFAPVN